MRLRELFDILKNTELKQIIIGEDDQKVFDLLNLALIEVYGKFNILQEEQIIKMVAGKTRYRLQDPDEPRGRIDEARSYNRRPFYSPFHQGFMPGREPALPQCLVP